MHCYSSCCLLFSVVRTDAVDHPGYRLRVYFCFQDQRTRFCSGFSASVLQPGRPGKDPTVCRLLRLHATSLEEALLFVTSASDRVSIGRHRKEQKASLLFLKKKKLEEEEEAVVAAVEVEEEAVEELKDRVVVYLLVFRLEVLLLAALV